ncbi:hypothetical protein [Sphingomonas bacterium]|uniref:hypothetical protein n=1 Tax=Sphingomonas bacterium TaxID=1895847 RepID=UPI001576413F|nr:hypothetical protein [Sphingomonas bacterium]
MASLPRESELAAAEPMAGRTTHSSTRQVRTDLPWQIAPLADEADLVHQHLKGVLADLFGETI